MFCRAKAVSRCFGEAETGARQTQKVSRSCRARFPASHGSLYAAVYSRQLSRIPACLAALARLGVTPRFARPKHLASLGRVAALPRFARPGLALQVVKLCGCRIRGRQTGRGAWTPAEQATQGLELKLLHFYFTFTSLLLHFAFDLALFRFASHARELLALKPLYS